jgi:DNA polymerase-3 subunit epsilon
MAELRLNRPLAFFDLETTGTRIASDRIVEIAVLKIMPDGSRLEYYSRINPGIPIPAEASSVHGIYDADVADKPLFQQLAPSLFDFLIGCDLAGYNALRFDIPLLMEEFFRAGYDLQTNKRRIVDAQVIFHKMEERTLKAALRFFCGKELENAHSAMADTQATYEVLKGQLDKYPELMNDVDFLHAFTNNPRAADWENKFVLNAEGSPVINFGKHKGRLLKQVFADEPSYYHWMMNGDFLHSTKNYITTIYKQVYPNA